MQHPVAAALRIATTTTATASARKQMPNWMSEYYLQPKANATKEWQLWVSGWLRNSGWHCVLCTLCLPAKMHVNETIWSEICKHAAKMHFVLCKGKSIGAWLGFALPDLPNVMTMPATRCLFTHTHIHTHWQTVTVQCVCPCRFRYSVSLFTYHKFFVGEYVFKWAKTGTNSRDFFVWNQWWFFKNQINKYHF